MERLLGRSAFLYHDIHIPLSLDLFLAHCAAISSSWCRDAFAYECTADLAPRARLAPLRNGLRHCCQSALADGPVGVQADALRVPPRHHRPLQGPSRVPVWSFEVSIHPGHALPTSISPRLIYTPEARVAAGSYHFPIRISDASTSSPTFAIPQRQR